MYKMSSHERFTRMFEHMEADRVPIVDYPWDATIERWRREGMPEGADFSDYFDIDKVSGIYLDISPRYETKTLEETDEYIIYTTNWGATLKQWKHATSTPQFINYTITTHDKWLEAKKHITPAKDRIPWGNLEKNYKRWKEEGHWLQAGFWFGFDVSHSWVVGTETFMIALIEEPEWCVDMWNHCLDMDIALYDEVWEAGYRFDSITWPDDMGYNHNQFFSVNTYRELLKPVHKRAIDWAHAKGIKAEIHSCGDINPFVRELIDIGIDSINPLEVKAGMNPVELKRKHGKNVVFQGGINAVLWDDFDAISEEMRRIVPVMKESGGYIFSSDHSVPSSVSLKDFSCIIQLAKNLGSY
ncbi:MAG: uroporphyrinogen decarboxylase family protein [Clostridiales bacterium]|nr:uroporphyrinogen decarboxylase family protein [Clostridiales bacterium]